MTQNIQDILQSERKRFAHIHIFFWILTWISCVAIFLYCNGWKINPVLPSSSSSVPSSSGSSMTSPNVVERFGFILVDTQSNQLSIGVDDDKPIKKDIQKSVPYGTHSVSLMGEQGELMSFQVDINAEKPFFRRNFTLFHTPVQLSGALQGIGAPRSLLGECDVYRDTMSGSYYQNCSKKWGSWSYGTMISKGGLSTKNTTIPIDQANGAGYIDSSGALFFPKNYFVTKSYGPLSDIHSPIKDIFSHLGQDFAISAEGSILSLGSDGLSPEIQSGSWAQAKTIGGDIFLVHASGGLHFFDELYRSREIKNITLKTPQSYLNITPYEHAYLISTREGSYLYQPYQEYAERLSDYGIYSIDGEIIDFMTGSGAIERIMLSAINPQKK